MLVQLIKKKNTGDIYLAEVGSDYDKQYYDALSVVELRETDDVAIPQRGEEIPIERGPAYSMSAKDALHPLNPKADFPISVIASALYAEKENKYLPCIFQTNQGDVVVFTKAGLDEHHRIWDENRKKSENQEMSETKALNVLQTRLMTEENYMKLWRMVIAKSFEDAMKERYYQLPLMATIAQDVATRFLNDFLNDHIK